MSEVKIPFSPEMKKAALEGMKIATTRGERKGFRGDTFRLDGVKFRILDVHLIHLENVKNLLYTIEGFTSPREFEDTWRKLHGGQFSTDKVYYIHFFTRIPEVANHGD